MIWALIALVSLVAVAALGWPMLRRRSDVITPRSAFDLAVYRDQLAELDRDHARGLLSDAERDAARLEVERRMLAAVPAQPAGEALIARRTTTTRAVALVLLVPALALALYFTVGAPGLGGRGAQQTAAAAQRAEVARYVDRLADHLKTSPDDARGWSMLGRSYVLLARFGEAIAAYQRAEALAPNDADLVSRHAEARIMADGGTVGEEARALIDKALTLDPKEPRGRFYQALGEAQAGRERDALNLLVALEADTPPDAAWRPVVAARIDELARELGLDPARVPGRAEAPAQQAERTPPADMSADEQQKMIRGMVAGLAERLAQQPNDPDGWARLGRSYGVLGEPEKARDAWRQAAELKPGDKTTLAEYASAILTLSGDRAPPPEFTAVAAALLRVAPEDPDALWFAGLAARARGDAQSARAYWNRLMDRLPAESPARDEVARAIAELK